MRIKRAIPILFIVLFFSCNTGEKKQVPISLKHGGVLHLNEPDFGWNFNPHSINNQADKNVANQVFEGLIKYNPKNLTIAPALTKYWIFGEGGKQYTFFLRTNAFFHQNECFATPDKTRKIVAADFKYSFEKLCTYSNEKQTIPIALKEIVGAEEYFNATKKVKPRKGISGIEVVNDSTLNINIKAPNSLFINSLAGLGMVVLPKEGIEMYGEENYVGCGPFYFNGKPKKGEKLILVRNENYYFKDMEGFSLPYFANIEISFIDSGENEIELFENGGLDIVFNVPAKVIPGFLDKHADKFKRENPQYILSKDEAGGLQPTYILQHSNLKNFTTNRHNFIDYTRVYFEKSKQQE